MKPTSWSSIIRRDPIIVESSTSDLAINIYDTYSLRQSMRWMVIVASFCSFHHVKMAGGDIMPLVGIRKEYDLSTVVCAVFTDQFNSILHDCFLFIFKKKMKKSDFDLRN